MLVFGVIHHYFRVLAWCVTVVDMQYIFYFTCSFLSYNLEIRASSLKMDCVLLFISLSILVFIFFYYFLFCFNAFWSFFFCFVPRHFISFNFFLSNLIFILLIVYSLCFTFLLIFFNFIPRHFILFFVKSQNYYLKLGRSLNCIPWAVN